MLRLKIPPGRDSDLIQALRAVMLAAQWNRGWIRGQVHRDLADAETVYYLEDWLTCEDATREVQSARFNRLLELMEAATEPPELQFQFISEVRGLDFVAEVRGGQHPSAA